MHKRPNVKFSLDNSRNQTIQEQNNKCVNREDFNFDPIEDEFLVRTYTVDVNVDLSKPKTIVYNCYDIEDLYNHTHDKEGNIINNNDPYTGGVFDENELNIIQSKYIDKRPLIDARKTRRENEKSQSMTKEENETLQKLQREARERQQHIESQHRPDITDIVDEIIEENGASALVSATSDYRHEADFKPEVAEELLNNRGYDVHYEEDYALREAVMLNKLRGARFLLQHDADPNVGALLLLTATSKYKQMFNLLLEFGAEIEGLQLVTAMSMGKYESLRMFLDHGVSIDAKNEALLYAIMNKHIDAVKLLLDHNADIHAITEENLRTLAGNGDEKMLDLLIERGADLQTALEVANFYQEKKERYFLKRAILRHEKTKNVN